MMDKQWPTDSGRYQDDPSWAQRRRREDGGDGFGNPSEYQNAYEHAPHPHPESSPPVGVDFNSEVNQPTFDSNVFSHHPSGSQSSWFHNNNHQRSLTHPTISSASHGAGSPLHTNLSSHFVSATGQPIAMEPNFPMGTVHPDIMPDSSGSIVRNLTHPLPHHPHNQPGPSSGQHRMQNPMSISPFSVHPSSGHSRAYDQSSHGSMPRLYVHRPGHPGESDLPVMPNQFSSTVGVQNLHDSYPSMNGNSSRMMADSTVPGAHLSSALDRGEPASHRPTVDPAFHSQLLHHSAIGMAMSGNDTALTAPPGNAGPSTAPEEPVKRPRGRPRKIKQPSEVKPQPVSKKKPHNEVEKRYRDGLKRAMQVLGDAVPIVHPSDYESEEEEEEEEQQQQQQQGRDKGKQTVTPSRGNSSRQHRQGLTKSASIMNSVEYIKFIENESARFMLEIVMLRDKLTRLNGQPGSSPESSEHRFGSALLRRIEREVGMTADEATSRGISLLDEYDFHCGCHGKWSVKRTNAWREALVDQIDRRYNCDDPYVGAPIGEALETHERGYKRHKQEDSERKSERGQGENGDESMAESQLSVELPDENGTLSGTDTARADGTSVNYLPSRERTMQHQPQYDGAVPMSSQPGTSSSGVASYTPGMELPGIGHSGNGPTDHVPQQGDHSGWPSTATGPNGHPGPVDGGDPSMNSNLHYLPDSRR